MKKYERLGEYISEYSVRNKANEDIQVYSVTNTNGFCTEYFDKDVASKDQTNYKIVPKGYFAYNPSRINVGSIDCQSVEDRVIVSPLYVVFKADERVDNNYLLHYLKSDIGKTYINDLASGSVRANLKFSILQEFPFPMIPIEEQKEKMVVIAKIDESIACCDSIIEKLDLAVKSRFIEMFGTLEKPKENYPQDCLENLCRKITDGKHGGCTRVEGSGRWFVGAREIYDDAVHYETAPEIDVDEFAKDYRRCNIEKGDFLIVNTGATIGKSAIASDDRTECTLLQKSVALLKVKTDILDPVFLKYCYAVNERMYRIGDGSAQPNLLLSKINKTEIYVPPLVKQNEFGMFVKEIDKSKLAVQEMKNKMEILKASVMQEYFC